MEQKGALHGMFPLLKTTFNTQTKPYDNLILCQHKEIYFSSYNFSKSGGPSLGGTSHIIHTTLVTMII
jgi:hypothetical protein